MAETSIEWTATPRIDGTLAPGFTFNPWEGCSRVSAGCQRCYAETRAKRFGTVQWGPNGTRRVASESYWRQPLNWGSEAETSGVRRRVFCASLADVFEDWTGLVVGADGEERYEREGKFFEFGENDCPAPGESGIGLETIRRRLFRLIDATPNLDWLLLTKRPENVLRMMPKGYMPRPNVWIGTSVENQQAADERIPHLLNIPAAVRFLSVEPMLGSIVFDSGWSVRGKPWVENGVPAGVSDGIDWVIVGGESGHGARPCKVEWIRSIVKQCEGAGVPCFVKQMGSNIVTRNDMIEEVFNDRKSGWPSPDVDHDIHGFREEYQGADCRIRLMNSKGGDPGEWPEDLRIRQWPN